MNVRVCFIWPVIGVLLLASCASRSVPEASRVQSEHRWLDLADGLRVDRESRIVAVRAWVCLDRGWLEQVLCRPGTREHESLMVTDVAPSSIHAALLLIGLEPGRPGRWIEEEGEIRLTPPVGDSVDVMVRYEGDRSDGVIDVPVTDWIADVATKRTHPRVPYIFAGSLMYEEVQGDSNYAADHSGSVIGLVTFGDELLGAMEVIPDAESIRAPEWVVRTEAIAAVGTEVLVLLSPSSEGSAGF